MTRLLPPLARAVVAAVVVAGCSVPTSGGGDLVTPSEGVATAPPIAENGDGAASGTDDADGAPAEPAAQFVFVRVQFDDVLDDAELAALAALPGVEEVRAARRDDGALRASRRADGTPVDDLPTDFKVSVALQVEEDDGVVDLAPGEVAITSEGRQFRDLDVGDRVVLTDEVERTVAAVVDDPRVAGVEFVVAEEDAAALDVRGRQRGLLTLRPDADGEAVAAAAADLLGEGAVTQARVDDGRPFVLSLPQTKERFGEFAFKDLPGRDIQAGASWIRENIVDERIPVLGRVVCHRLIMDDLVAVMEDLQESGLAGEIDPDLYGGCWAPRRINRNANLSRHAWGIGIDINVDFDVPGGGPIPSQGVIDAFERHGFRWGGEYPFPDNHHFEWVGRG